jgi:hypothetical protein
MWVFPPKATHTTNKMAAGLNALSRGAREVAEGCRENGDFLSHERVQETHDKLVNHMKSMHQFHYRTRLLIYSLVRNTDILPDYVCYFVNNAFRELLLERDS